MTKVFLLFVIAGVPLRLFAAGSLWQATITAVRGDQTGNARDSMGEESFFEF